MKRTEGNKLRTMLVCTVVGMLIGVHFDSEALGAAAFFALLILSPTQENI